MTAYYNEFDPGAAVWLRELIKRGLIADGEVDERSILDVTADDLKGFTQCHFFAGIGGWSYALRLAGIPDDMKVWTGSPPCQPFSTAGQQKGKDDERHLAPHFASLISAGRPPILFGEQVASAAVFGKAARKARSQSEGEPEWAWIDDLQDRLEAAHYAVGASDIPAAGVGAPHIRQRTFFGAVRLADAGESTGEWNTRGVSGAQAQEHGARASVDGTLPVGPEHAGAGVGRLADTDSQRHDRFNPLLQRQEPGRHEQNSVEATGGSETIRLADTYNSRPQGRPRVSECSDQLSPWTPSMGFRLADTGCNIQRSQLEDGEEASGFSQKECEPIECSNVSIRCREGDNGSRIYGSDGSLGLTGRTRPLDGFWRDADWLFCRDGKWRPVEPASQRMANGLSLCLGSMRGTCVGEKEGALNAEEAIRIGGKALQVLRETDGAEAFWLSVGGRIGFPQATFLLAVMCKYSRELGIITDSETSGSEQDSQDFLRALRERASQTSRSSQGSGCSEQFTKELGDALSKLSQDSAQHRELMTSLASYTSGPLAQGVSNRVGRLRGYGNAIVPQAAAQFVRAFIDATP